MKKLVPFYFLLLLISCGSISDEFTEICKYEITTVKPSSPKSLIGSEVILSQSVVSSFSNIMIYDSLLLAYQGGSTDGYFYHIFNFNDSENLGRFIRSGRANNEVLAIPPIKQHKVVDNQLLAYVYDFNNSRTLLWNVSQSLNRGADIYDTVMDKQERKQAYSHLFYLPNDKFAAHTVLYYARGPENIIPAYYIGQTSTNQFIDTLDLYSRIITSGNEGDISRYLQTEDAIKPDESKIVVGMQYQSHIAILDLLKNEVQGVNIDNGVRFNPNDLRICFNSIDADDSYIYALFLGSKLNMTIDEEKQIRSILYKFDWEGNLVNTYGFEDLPIFTIAVDKGSQSRYLYGVDVISERIYKFDLSK